MKKSFLSLLFAATMGLFVFNACSDDNDVNPESKPLNYRMLVVNEGNFTKGNSDITVIGRDNAVQNKVFETVNNRPLGDVGQSATLIDGKLYVSLNNSAKIEVMDAASFTQIATILDDNKEKKPQYVLPLGNNQALVSDLTRTMNIINTTTNQWESTLDAGSGSKQMIVAENKAYVNAGKLLVINISDKSIKTKIDLSVAGHTKLVKDYQGNIWVMTTTGLHMINPKTDAVEKTLPFVDAGIAVSSWSTRLDISKDGKNLYFYGSNKATNSQGIYRVNVADAAIGASPIFSIDGKVSTLYNMAVSPEGTIVICDALDYTQSGYVIEFDETGTELNKWTAGIIPQYILFTDK